MKYLLWPRALGFETMLYLHKFVTCTLKIEYLENLEHSFIVLSFLWVLMRKTYM